VKRLPAALAADAETVLHRQRDLFAGLQGARLLITGGTGFIGRWLTLTLVHAIERLDLDCTAVVLTRDRQRCLASTAWLGHPSMHLLECDIRSLAPEAIHPVSHVIHGAAEVSRPDQPLLGLGTAMRGTSALLQLDVLPRAQRFLLLSSGAVYGASGHDGCIPETCPSAPDPLDARLAYQQGKRACESLCAAGRAEGRLGHLSVARIFAAFGPFLPAGCGFAAADLLHDACAGGPLRVRGDGRAVRSYLYAGDLAGWLWTILLRGADGGAYNVGSDQPVSIAELARAIAARHPTRPQVDILGQAAPGRAANRYLPDISKARSELGLAPWTSLDAAIDRSLAFSMSAP